MPGRNPCHVPTYLSATMPLVVILLVGLLLRLVCLTHLTQAINGEGAEYARIAENLVAGKGYVGIAMEGRELMFPPLYPLLIAVSSFFTDDFYRAAQLVSLISGMFLLLFVFGIAKDLYGRPTAHLAVGLAALHPVLNQLSATTWVESLYITLIAGSIYFINRCRYSSENRHWLSAGSLLGLGYLTCPQAIIFPFIFLIALFFLYRSREQTILLKTGIFAGSFFVLALPYIVFLSVSTGGLRIEGKTIVNNELGKQILSGIPEKISAYEVTEDLVAKGVWMRPNAEVAASSGSADYRTTLRIVCSKGIKNISKVIMAFSSEYFVGAPLILPLAVLGLFGTAWTRARASGELFLLLTAGGSLLSLTTIIHMFQTRYYFVLIPFFLLWAAKGIDEIARWALRSAASLRLLNLAPKFAGRLAAVLACIGVVSLFALGANGVDTFNADRSPRSVALRSSGQWLAGIAGQKTVMDTGTPLAFHAGARYVPMPWCDAQTALRFAEQKGVNFVVVKSWEANSRPYLQEWLTSGVPSANAYLAHSSGVDPENRIFIFRVDRSSEFKYRKTSTVPGNAKKQR